MIFWKAYTLATLSYATPMGSICPQMDEAFYLLLSTILDQFMLTGRTEWSTWLTILVLYVAVFGSTPLAFFSKPSVVWKRSLTQWQEADVISIVYWAPHVFPRQGHKNNVTNNARKKKYWWQHVILTNSTLDFKFLWVFRDDATWTAIPLVQREFQIHSLSTLSRVFLKSRRRRRCSGDLISSLLLYKDTESFK